MSYYLHTFEESYCITPLQSLVQEKNGEKFYYCTLITDYNNTISHLGLPVYHYFTTGHSQGTLWYTKEEIDKLPLRLRRGGIYGHDCVKLTNNKDKLLNNIFNNGEIKRIRNLLKLHGFVLKKHTETPSYYEYIYELA